MYLTLYNFSIIRILDDSSHVKLDRQTESLRCLYT